MLKLLILFIVIYNIYGISKVDLRPIINQFKLAIEELIKIITNKKQI